MRAPIPAHLHLHGEGAVDPGQPRAAGGACETSRPPGAREEHAVLRGCFCGTRSPASRGAPQPCKSISPAASGCHPPAPETMEGRGASPQGWSPPVPEAPRLPAPVKPQVPRGAGGRGDRRTQLGGKAMAHRRRSRRLRGGAAPGARRSSQLGGSGASGRAEPQRHGAQGGLVGCFPAGNDHRGPTS